MLLLQASPGPQGPHQQDFVQEDIVSIIRVYIMTYSYKN